MVVFPNCKINIGLNVCRRRPDGFHDIETVFYPVPWFDILEIIPSEKQEFTFAGVAIDCELKDNLCYKAYQLLNKNHQLPAVKLFLYKNIPSGAGLGGGSADAALTLLTLNQLFSLNLTEDELMRYASLLGSDCTFFIKNQPVFAIGKGDVFSDVSVDLTGYYLLIVKPAIHINTSEAFRMLSPRLPNHSVKDLIQLPHTEWRNSIINDFETAVFSKYAELKVIKEKLYSMGAVYAAMSGSGSALYGLFNNKVDYSKEFPGKVCWMRMLRDT